MKTNEISPHCGDQVRSELDEFETCLDEVDDAPSQFDLLRLHFYYRAHPRQAPELHHSNTHLLVIVDEVPKHYRKQTVELCVIGCAD